MSEKVKPKKPIGTRNKTNKKTRNTTKKRTYLNPNAKPLFIPALKQAMVESPFMEEDVSVKSEYELPANNNRGYESSKSSSKQATKSSSKQATKKIPVFDVEEYNRLVHIDTTNETNMETEMCDIDSLVPITTELINKQNIFSVTRSVKDIEKSIDEIVNIGLNNSNYPICVSLVFVIMGFMTIDELNDEYETQKKIQRGRSCGEIFDFLERNGIYTKISYFDFAGKEGKLIDYVKLLLPVGGITPIIQSGNVCGHIGLLMRMAKDEIYYIDAMDNSAFLLSAEDNTFIKNLQKYKFDQNTIGFLLTPDTWIKQGKKRKREEHKIVIRKQKTKKHRK
jgi:hypothetical protein